MSLADAFAGMRAAEAPEPKGSKSPNPRIPRSPDTRIPKPLPASRQTSRGITKRSHPDYMQLKAYVPRDLQRQAWRKWQDATGEDFSGLIEHLLQEYLNT